MNRFELENFKNVLIIDDSIVISNRLYQSVNDFKYRKVNSDSDELHNISEILAIEFHSVGHILFLKFINKKINLEFYSNERMMEFLNFLLSDNFKKVSLEKLNLTKSIIPVIIPIVTFLLLCYFAIITFKIVGISKYLTLLVGFIIAIVFTVKKLLKSTITKYENVRQQH